MIAAAQTRATAENWCGRDVACGAFSLRIPANLRVFSPSASLALKRIIGRARPVAAAGVSSGFCGETTEFTGVLLLICLTCPVRADTYRELSAGGELRLLGTACLQSC
jgi:hypothetical protein